MAKIDTNELEHAYSRTFRMMDYLANAALPIGCDPTSLRRVSCDSA